MQVMMHMLYTHVSVLTGLAVAHQYYSKVVAYVSTTSHHVMACKCSCIPAACVQPPGPDNTRPGGVVYNCMCITCYVFILCGTACMHMYMHVHTPMQAIMWVLEEVPLRTFLPVQLVAVVLHMSQQLATDMRLARDGLVALTGPALMGVPLVPVAAYTLLGEHMTRCDAM